ncbi:MAG: spore maturation protein [Clostridiales bacterium]|nr:spore maturation protein [Clostridiales bacterium]
MTSLVVPAIVLSVSLLAFHRKCDVYTSLCEGASDGLKVIARIFPAIVILLSAIAVFRVSGAQDLLIRFIAPALKAVGIPSETAPLMLVRPFSGSAALAVGSEIISRYGADSDIGRTAAVMLGSTETTFYTMAVYLSAAKIRGPRFALPAALIGDLVGFIAASASVRLLY